MGTIIEAMKTAKLFPRLALSLGAVGIAVAVFLWGHTSGMGIVISDELSKYSVPSAAALGPTIFEEMSSRYLFISAGYLLVAIFLVIRSRIPFLSLGILIALLFIASQCRLLIILKNRVFETNWAFTDWLWVTYYLDLVLLIIAGILFSQQIYSMFADFRLKIRRPGPLSMS